jgi:hypothetical protein
MFNQYQRINSLISSEEADSIFNSLVCSDEWHDRPDNQVPLAKSKHNHPVIDDIHDRIKPILEDITGKTLRKTYHYTRIYKKNSVLLPHTDREACEYSVTMLLGYKGPNWAIKVLNNETLDEESFLLNPGDGVLYKGCDVVHWREPSKSPRFVQTFLHYVDVNGPNKDAA